MVGVDSPNFGAFPNLSFMALLTKDASRFRQNGSFVDYGLIAIATEKHSNDLYDKPVVTFQTSALQRSYLRAHAEVLVNEFPGPLFGMDYVGQSKENELKTSGDTERGSLTF